MGFVEKYKQIYKQKSDELAKDPNYLRRTYYKRQFATFLLVSCVPYFFAGIYLEHHFSREQNYYFSFILFLFVFCLSAFFADQRTKRKFKENK